MALKPLTRLGSASLHRSLRASAVKRTSVNASLVLFARSSAIPITQFHHAISTSYIRNFHPSSRRLGIMPDAENPPPKESEESDPVTVPTDISTSEYHERADEYLDDLFNRLEGAQEKRPELDVEYSAGVMEVSIANKGTYVLNKQPPNKQIWLSSPLTGPKRYDWVVTGEGLHEKEGGGRGDWIYLRDGSSLTELVQKELGIKLGINDDTLH